MKRDPCLVPLSREHHAALRLGRSLMTGGGVAELRRQLRTLKAHFAGEEHCLLPLLRTNGRQMLAQRLREEHVVLSELFDDALHGDQELAAEAAAEAGKALIKHVRFEERELFPVIEQLLEAARPFPGAPHRLAPVLHLVACGCQPY